MRTTTYHITHTPAGAGYQFAGQAYPTFLAARQAMSAVVRRRVRIARAVALVRSQDRAWEEHLNRIAAQEAA